MITAERLTKLGWHLSAEGNGGLQVWHKREWRLIMSDYEWPTFSRVICIECGETFYHPAHNHCDV